MLAFSGAKKNSTVLQLEDTAVIQTDRKLADWTVSSAHHQDLHGVISVTEVSEAL